MHSAYKSLGAFETLASDLCINYHICTCTFYKHTSLFNFFRRSADMLLTSIKACLICSLRKGVYKCLLTPEPFLLAGLQFTCTQKRTNDWLLCQLVSC